MGICYSTKTSDEVDEDKEEEEEAEGDEDGDNDDVDNDDDDDDEDHESLEEDGDGGGGFAISSELLNLKSNKSQETIEYNGRSEKQRKPPSSSSFLKRSSPFRVFSSSPSSSSPFRPSPFRFSSPFRASPGNGSSVNGVKRPFPPPSPSKHIQIALLNRHGIETGLPKLGSRTEEQNYESLFGYRKDFSVNYDIGEEIGRGHFGHTCRAKIKKGRMKGHDVAVKVISKAKMTTAIAIDDVRREVKILRALSGHKNLIRFYDAYEDDRNVYMVMELCEGGELLDRILARGGRYSEEEAKVVIVQILDVVTFFHLQGVVHRDLKPENFLYTTKDENAKLKVIDFGLSDFVRPDERLDDIVGSAYYVAPEVLRKSYSIEADVWSIGVITYILLCGSRPFWARTESGIFRSVLKADPSFDEVPWPAISDVAKDFVKRLLTKNRHKRMTAAQALAHPWVRGYKRIPLDILVFRSVKSYFCSSTVRRTALKAFSKTLSEDDLFYLQAQFLLLSPSKNGRVSFNNFKSALMKNATEAMNISRILEMMASMNGLQFKMDFEEFCSAAISIPQFERWEWQVDNAYEIFEDEGNRVVMIEDLPKELGVPSTIPAHLVLRDWVRHNDGKLSFFAFKNLLLGMLPQSRP